MFINAIVEAVSEVFNTLFNIVSYVTTYVTAIPRGVATLTYYIHQLPPFITPFLITIVSFAVLKAIFSLI